MRQMARPRAALPKITPINIQRLFGSAWLPCLLRCLWRRRLLRARLSRTKTPRVPLLTSRRLLLPLMLFRATRTQAIPKLERTTRPMSKAPMLLVMPVLRATLRPFRAPLSMRCLLAILRMLKKRTPKRLSLWLRFPRTRAMQTLLLPLLPRRFPARPRSSSRAPRIRTTRIPRSRGRSRLARRFGQTCTTRWRPRTIGVKPPPKLSPSATPAPGPTLGLPARLRRAATSPITPRS